MGVTKGDTRSLDYGSYGFAFSSSKKTNTHRNSQHESLIRDYVL